MKEKLQELYRQTMELIGRSEYTVEEVAMSEAEAPAKEEVKADEPLKFDADAQQKLNDIHDFLFTDEEEVPLAQVEDLAQEAPEKEAKVEDSKPEVSQEDLKAQLKAELLAEMKAEQQAKEEKAEAEAKVEDPLVHNPETKPDRIGKWVAVDPKTVDLDDPTAAFTAIIGDI